MGRTIEDTIIKDTKVLRRTLRATSVNRNAEQRSRNVGGDLF
jgi:hypothetical protein